MFSFPVKLFEYLNENKVTTICWVASALCLCVELHAFSGVALETVNKVFFTGSVMPCKYLREWQEALPHALYVNHYGPTEITASCTYYVVDHPVEPEEVLPIGTHSGTRESCCSKRTARKRKTANTGKSA